MIFRVLVFLALLVGGAQAQGPILPGPGLPVAGAANPTVTYVGSVTMANFGSGPFSDSTFDIGNPSYISTRRVIVVMDGGADSAVPTSATINGVSADVLTTLSNSCGSFSPGCVDFISAVVPTGTTNVTISVSVAAAINTVAVWSVYIVDNSLLSAPTSPTTGINGNSGGSGNVTTTINTTGKAGGFIIAGEWCGGGAGPAITGTPTETYTTDYSNSAHFSAHANGITANASNSLSTQCPPAGGSVGLGMAAWR